MSKDGTQPNFRAGPLFVDFALRRVQLDGQDVQLTPTEYDLLKDVIAMLVFSVAGMLLLSQLRLRRHGHCAGGGAGARAGLPAEQSGNPILTSVGANQQVSATQSGGNMEGKEVRFAITAVFIAGLMVGRTPEYLGKKIERKEIMMAALALLILPASILGFSAVASVIPQGVSSILNPGPHGLSEILYLFTSSNGNNGSAFAGINGRAELARVLGVIELKDIVKGGMRTRFDELRKMGIRTIMITGDNALAAAAIAKESGVDDFLAQATPETKMKLIKEQQRGGRMVAMTGDGTNDAPALAQADVGVAMNTGTQAAKEAANMVDLDSNPTKLIEVLEVGKQLLITRGSLLRRNLLIYGIGGIIIPFIGIKAIDLILQVLHLTL
jgi:soluble P-type ATPase